MPEGIHDWGKSFDRFKRAAIGAAKGAYSPPSSAELKPFTAFLKLDVEATDAVVVRRALEELKKKIGDLGPMLAVFIGGGEEMKIVGVEVQLDEGGEDAESPPFPDHGQLP